MSTPPVVTPVTPIANRAELAQAFGPNQSAVRRLEQMTKDITATLPNGLDQVNGVAQQALQLVELLQQVAFVLASASADVPNGAVLTEGTGITITLGAETITVALVVPVAVANGGTGATAAAAARTNLGAAASGANDDITSLTGLTTPLATTEGGTGVATLTPNGVIVGNGGGPLHATAAGTAGQMLLSRGMGNDPVFGSNPTITGGTIDGADIGDTTPAKGAFTQLKNGETVLIHSTVTLGNGAGAQTATLTNAPAAGNPTKWLPVDDNGTTRYVPAW